MYLCSHVREASIRIQNLLTHSCVRLHMQAVKRLIEAGVGVDTKKMVTHITDRARVNEGL